MSAVIDRPTQEKARPQSASFLPAPSAERSFMEGKALAALMVRESGFRRGGDRADLNASYREPGEAQDNFTRPFLELVMKEPQLLEGFSAALSSMFAEGFDPGLVNLAHQADCTAKINYSACTTYRDQEEYEDFNSHSEPPLDEQLAKFSLEDLATTPAEAHNTDGGQPKEQAIPSPSAAADARKEYWIEGNFAGMTRLQSREELQTFIRQRADLIANLSVCFGEAFDTADSGFMEGFQQHLNDLIYQQQNAIDAFFESGSEA